MPATNSVNVANHAIAIANHAIATIANHAIATRMPNNLEGISRDIQLYPKTTNIIVSVPIAANGGVIIIDRFALQMGKM